MKYYAMFSKDAKTFVKAKFHAPGRRAIIKIRKQVPEFKGSRIDKRNDDAFMDREFLVVYKNGKPTKDFSTMKALNVNLWEKHKKGIKIYKVENKRPYLVELPNGIMFYPRMESFYSLDPDEKQELKRLKKVRVNKEKLEPFAKNRIAEIVEKIKNF